LPGIDLAQCFVDHPLAEFDGCLRILDAGRKSRAAEAAFRMLPADQRLGAITTPLRISTLGW
jgi:hypothetical protein